MGMKRAKGGFAGRRRGCPSDGRPHQLQRLLSQSPLGLDKSLQNPVSCGLNVDFTDRGPGALPSELTVCLGGDRAVWPCDPRGRSAGVEATLSRRPPSAGIGLERPSTCCSQGRGRRPSFGTEGEPCSLLQCRRVLCWNQAHPFAESLHILNFYLCFCRSDRGRAWKSPSPHVAVPFSPGRPPQRRRDGAAPRGSLALQMAPCLPRSAPAQPRGPLGLPGRRQGSRLGWCTPCHSGCDRFSQQAERGNKANVYEKAVFLLFECR